LWRELAVQVTIPSDREQLDSLTELTPSIAAPVVVVPALLATESSPWYPRNTTLYAYLLAPFRIPCDVTTTWAEVKVAVPDPEVPLAFGPLLTMLMWPKSPSFPVTVKAPLKLLSAKPSTRIV
jgi:hypothetical protein